MIKNTILTKKDFYINNKEKLEKEIIKNLEEKRLDEVNNIIKDYISNQNNI